MVGQTVYAVTAPCPKLGGVNEAAAQATMENHSHHSMSPDMPMEASSLSDAHPCDDGGQCNNDECPMNACSAAAVMGLTASKSTPRSHEHLRVSLPNLYVNQHGKSLFRPPISA